MIRAAAVILTFLTVVTASAQWPLFDPDDFLDQRAGGGRPVLISRIVVGAASNMSGDGFRPLGEHVGYVHLANSFYWGAMQFDYKRSQMKAEDGEAAQWRIVKTQTTIEVPNGVAFTFSVSEQQTRKATPKSKDTLHAAWYWPVAGGGGGIPVMLRSRVTFATQPIETDVTATTVTPNISSTTTERMSGRERTFALDTDTWFRIAGHDVFGSLAVSRTKTTGTRTDRDESAITYTNRFPAFSYDSAKILIRPTLTVGGISHRGSSGVSLINPAIEVFRPFVHSGANLHVIWSPQWAANGSDWKVTHQLLVLVDRALFVKFF